VTRCLEKDIARRPRNVAELAVALKPFASAEGRLAVDRIARIGGAPRSSMASAPDGGRAAAMAASSSPTISSPVASAPAVSAPVAGGVPGDLATGYAETVATHQTTRTLRRRRRMTTVAVVIGALALAIVTLVTRSSTRTSGDPVRSHAPALGAEALVPATPETAAPPLPSPAPEAPLAVAPAASSAPATAPSSPQSATAAVTGTSPPPAQRAPVSPTPRPVAPHPATSPSKTSPEDLLLERH
jgi:serine/threonine-protein kinase